MTSRALPAALTSYDLLKTFAVISMICDHIGDYFFPENLWWRALTLSAPIWFFLIGFAKTRDLSTPLWVGCIILVASTYVVGEPILPLNVLATMIFYRVVIDFVMERVHKNKENLYIFAFIAAVLALPSFIVFDYGTSGFLYAMLGYIVRRRDAMGFSKQEVFFYGGIAWALFSALQVKLFWDYDTLQSVAACAGFFAITLLLVSFRPQELPRLTAVVPNPVKTVLQFCGRHSLWIYVAHLLVFKITALAMGYPGFGLFEFDLIGE